MVSSIFYYFLTDLNILLDAVDNGDNRSVYHTYLHLTRTHATADLQAPQPRVHPRDLQLAAELVQHSPPPGTHDVYSSSRVTAGGLSGTASA